MGIELSMVYNSFFAGHNFFNIIISLWITHIAQTEQQQPLRVLAKFIDSANKNYNNST